jgi:V/A-type H+/Na+-transporting ATPase subunit D
MGITWSDAAQVCRLLERRLETGSGAAREADRWLARAVLPGGGRQVDVGIAFVTQPAQVDVAWATVMGVRLPVDAGPSPAAGPDMVALGTGSALVLAAEAHRRALEAAVIHAAAEARHRRLETQLRRTVRRLRALRKRWIPRQESMLRDPGAILAWTHKRRADYPDRDPCGRR